jgi:hypothetical protein
MFSKLDSLADLSTVEFAPRWFARQEPIPPLPGLSLCGRPDCPYRTSVSQGLNAFPVVA